MKSFQPYFLTLNRDEQLATIEALIFSSSEVLSIELLFNLLFNKDEYDSMNKEEKNSTFKEFESFIFEQYHYDTNRIEDFIKEINKELEATRRPFTIVNFANGYQFATRTDFGDIVSKLYNYKIKKRLSPAAIESLAIVAYRQPISKSGIEEIRGVNSNEIVNSLLEKGLIRITGRSESLGKALVYGTTDEFLKLFGLNSLKDLPKLRELDEIASFQESIDNQVNIIEIEEKEETNN